jgi:hypothetical protein
MVGAFGVPCHPVHGQSTLGAWSPRCAQLAHVAWHGDHPRVDSSMVMRSSPRPSSEVLLQAATWITKRVGQNGVVASEAVGVAVADGITGGNFD